MFSVSSPIHSSPSIDLEEHQRQRRQVYCDCQSIFGKSIIQRATDWTYHFFEDLLNPENKRPSRQMLRKDLRDRLRTLNENFYDAHLLFLESPPLKARQNILIHADHLQGIPLYGALLQGIANIETDVRYHRGKLMIAHDEADLELGISFEDLYLKPLKKLARERRQLFSDAIPLSIFIDLKLSQSFRHSDQAGLFYDELYRLIEKYQDLLDHYDDNGTHQFGPVRFVITGDDRRVEQLGKQGLKNAYLFLDGRFGDVEIPQELIAMRSTRYPLLGDWRSLQRNHSQSSLKDIPFRFWSVPGDKETTPQKKTEALWEAFRDYHIVYNTECSTRLILLLEKSSESDSL